MSAFRRISEARHLLLSLSGLLKEEVPPLEAVLEAAKRDDAQPGIRWPRNRWVEAFPEYRSELDDLPDRLSRQDVRAACDRQARTSDGATLSFVVCMAWGHGESGYGVHRTQTVLQLAGGEAGPRLAIAQSAVITDGPLAGYAALADPARSRLHKLGPAFGTKFLFFQSPNALILDALIARWYQGITDQPLRPTVWKPDLYSVYLTQMQEWADSIGVRPDKIEQAAFQLMANEEGNQWSAQP